MLLFTRLFFIRLDLWMTWCSHHSMVGLRIECLFVCVGYAEFCLRRKRDLSFNFTMQDCCIHLGSDCCIAVFQKRVINLLFFDM